MTDVEVIVFVVFVSMGVYISYLHSKLREARFHAGFMADVLVRIAQQELELKETQHGIAICKRQDVGEVSVHQRGTP